MSEKMNEKVSVELDKYYYWMYLSPETFRYFSIISPFSTFSPIISLCKQGSSSQRVLEPFKVRLACPRLDLVFHVKSQILFVYAYIAMVLLNSLLNSIKLGHHALFEFFPQDII